MPVWDNHSVMLEESAVRRAVRLALEEDLGSGDLTSEAVVEAAARARASLVAREELVVCGLTLAREAFLQMDPSAAWTVAVDEGGVALAGATLARVAGTARGLLAAERTALNFLQRLSGIATATRRLVSRIAGSGVEIADTRKTAPGLRPFDKYAVRTGGGTNHRTGLYDGILIKDNHWRLAGGVGPALERARRRFGGRRAPGIGVEIEVTSLREVDEALAGGADALLLDNMDPATLRAAVARARGRAFLEISGGVSEERVAELAALGVQRISLGALTHSVRAVDIALEMEAA